MKFSLTFVASAAAVAAPTISLDLDESLSYKLKTPIVRPHDLKLKQPNGRSVLSRQDWTEKCPAGKSNYKNCPFPKANAYDHNDRKIAVKTRVFLVDADGKTVNKQVKKVDFSKRSTYLFKYDASDKAGNHAEQVVFALILDGTFPRVYIFAVIEFGVWVVCGASCGVF
jgi:hypothetical protein